MKNLDFIIIGAAKSGTTTLFELIKRHPEIAMPRDKEVPFFSDDVVYRKGIKKYLSTFFQGQDNEKIFGKITPQYMLGKGDLNPEAIAQRIRDNNTKTKIIALLRHPVDRSYSHYRMLYQRGILTEDFHKLVERLVNNGKLDEMRYNSISPENTFLLGSEYGRILSNYYRLFPMEQILVLYTDDLKKNPERFLERLFYFINIDNNFLPSAIGEEFRKGGSKAKIKLLTPGVLYKIPLVRAVWKNIVPHAFRKRLEYSLNLWNIKPEDDVLKPDDPGYKVLLDFYREDIKILEKLTCRKVPWINLH